MNSFSHNQMRLTRRVMYWIQNKKKTNEKLFWVHSNLDVAKLEIKILTCKHVVSHGETRNKPCVSQQVIQVFSSALDYGNRRVDFWPPTTTSDVYLHPFLKNNCFKCIRKDANFRAKSIVSEVVSTAVLQLVAESSRSFTRFEKDIFMDNT